MQTNLITSAEVNLETGTVWHCSSVKTHSRLKLSLQRNPLTKKHTERRALNEWSFIEMVQNLFIDKPVISLHIVK